MRYQPPPADFFSRNRDRLRDLLPPKSLVILHSNDLMPTNADGTMGFRQDSDLLHLTGIDQEETVLVLCPDHPVEEQREILFVRETSETLAIWEGAKLTKEAATEISGIANVVWTNDFETYLHRLAPIADQIFLTTNEHLRAADVVQTRNRRFIASCQERYPLHRYERLSPLMHRLRMIKDEVEIEMIRKAVSITAAGFHRVLKKMKPGIGEWEIEAEYIHEFLSRRSRGFAYPPIIGSGKNACVLHYLTNDQVCEDGQLVLMDVAAEYGNWNSDMTRTVPVNGRFSDRQRAVYDAVLRVLRGANDILRPGILLKDFQDQVLEIMEGELIGLGLFTTAEAKDQSSKKELVKKYFMHGTSHHLGLDVHDVAPHDAAVEVGMVFTIEPGIYLPEEGFGVRLEDNVVIREGENENLFGDIPIEADEIEELMNS